MLANRHPPSFVKRDSTRNSLATNGWSGASQEERDGRRKGKGSANHYLQDVEDDLSIAELQGAAHEEETDGLTSADESQDMAAKLAQAQLTINKCDLLIAKQALRIDELERVLRKFIQ